MFTKRHHDLTGDGRQTNRTMLREITSAYAGIGRIRSY